MHPALARPAAANLGRSAAHAHSVLCPGGSSRHDARRAGTIPPLVTAVPCLASPHRSKLVHDPSLLYGATLPFHHPTAPSWPRPFPPSLVRAYPLWLLACSAPDEQKDEVGGGLLSPPLRLLMPTLLLRPRTPRGLDDGHRTTHQSARRCTMICRSSCTLPPHHHGNAVTQGRRNSP